MSVSVLHKSDVGGRQHQDACGWALSMLAGGAFAMSVVTVALVTAVQVTHRWGVEWETATSGMYLLSLATPLWAALAVVLFLWMGARPSRLRAALPLTGWVVAAGLLLTFACTRGVYISPVG